VVEENDKVDFEKDHWYNDPNNKGAVKAEGRIENMFDHKEDM